jgi:hypothetical protein
MKTKMKNCILNSLHCVTILFMWLGIGILMFFVSIILTIIAMHALVFALIVMNYIMDFIWK